MMSAADAATFGFLLSRGACHFGLSACFRFVFLFIILVMFHTSTHQSRILFNLLKGR